MTVPNTRTRYFPHGRAERLIASGRMVLSAFFLLAIWLDHTEPTRYALLAYGILAGYLVYSLVLGATVWRRDSLRGYLQIFSHAVDLTVFAVLIFLTDGPTSPFFVYFVFLLVCATLRWQARGTLWTAIISLMIITLAFLPSYLLHGQEFELNRFIIRITYLAVVATLLGYLGALEQSMRLTLARLAEWPRSVPATEQALTHEMLDYAGDILAAPRMIFFWEEYEEPWLNLALWTRDGVLFGRERPGVFGTIVAEPLDGMSFFCENAADPYSWVVHHSPTGLERTQGPPPLHRQLQETFDVGAVLALPFRGEKIAGYLLVLDKAKMNTDDLVLGEIVAHEAATRLDHFSLLKQLQQGAASEERVRLARDLHDGLLQSLAGITLHLETVQRLIEPDPGTARQRIQEIQQLIGVEQRDLRSHIRQLRPAAADLSAEVFDLPARLADLTERIRRQWELTVEITTTPAAPRLMRSLAREIYFVVHEALINAVRHSGASTLRADLSFEAKRVHIIVIDDGRGFSFKGMYDHTALCAMKRGPMSLRERITAMEGTLAIDSRETGARLEIILPINDYGGVYAH